MTLYEIDKAIVIATEMAVDPETGEINDEAMLQTLEQLKIDREHKIENIGCYVKNLEADAKAIKEESKQTPRLSVSFRHTKKVEVDADMLDDIPDQYLRFKDPEPDKKAIGDALKAGEVIPGCELVESVSMIIK